MLGRSWSPVPSLADADPVRWTLACGKFVTDSDKISIPAVKRDLILKTHREGLLVSSVPASVENYACTLMYNKFQGLAKEKVVKVVVSDNDGFEFFFDCLMEDNVKGEGLIAKMAFTTSFLEEFERGRAL